MVIFDCSGFPKVGPPTRSQHAFMEPMAFQTSQIRKRPAPILPRPYYSSRVTGQSTATTELPLAAGAPSIHMARPHDLAGPQISTKRDPGTRGRNSYSLSPNLLWQSHGSTQNEIGLFEAESGGNRITSREQTWLGEDSVRAHYHPTHTARTS